MGALYGILYMGGSDWFILLGGYMGFSPGPRTLGGGHPAYAHTGQMENPENLGCATIMTGRKEWKGGGDPAYSFPTLHGRDPPGFPAVIPPTIVQLISISTPLSLWNGFILLLLLLLLIIIRVLHGHGGGLGRWIWEVTSLCERDYESCCYLLDCHNWGPFYLHGFPINFNLSMDTIKSLI